MRSQRNASQSVISSFEDDPEKAVKATQIADTTGQDPSVVFGNFDTFDRQLRTNLTDQLIKNNRFLSEFITENPIAAKVSHDDIGQLDAFSESMRKLGRRSPGAAGPMLDIASKGLGGIFGNAVEAFKEGSGGPQLGSWITRTPEGQQWAEDNPFKANAAAALGGVLELPAKVFSGGLAALNSGIKDFAIAYGMPENEAKRLARDLTGMAEYQLQQTPGKGVGVPKVGEAIGAGRTLGRMPLDQLAVEAREAYRISEPYLKAGKEPPLGLHPLIDEMKKRQLDLDLKNLDEALSEAQKSATRERVPALFENYAQRHNDARIGVSADAIAELYKNKRSSPDDNILGWVPDLEKQMYTALASGGDVEIPMGMWLARVDKEVAKQLHNFIRVRPNGLNATE